MSSINDSQVGFMSPPTSSRFQKGQSGNSKGRPKKKDDLNTLVQRVLKRKLRLKDAEKQIPIGEALIRKLRELALAGDRRALDLQRRILDEAGLNQTNQHDPEEVRMKVLKGFENMGVKVNYRSETDDK
jgi:hypothetical protein